MYLCCIDPVKVLLNDLDKRLGNHLELLFSNCRLKIKKIGF